MRGPLPNNCGTQQTRKTWRQWHEMDEVMSIFLHAAKSRPILRKTTNRDHLPELGLMSAKLDAMRIAVRFQLITAQVITAQ